MATCREATTTKDGAIGYIPTRRRQFCVSICAGWLQSIDDDRSITQSMDTPNEDRPRNHICCGLVFIDDCSTADSCDATQNEDSKNIYSAKRIQITCNYKVFIDGIKCNWNAIEMHEWFPVRRLKIISNKRRFWIQLLLRLLLCLEQWTYTKNYIMLYRYLLYIIAQRI